MWIRHTIQKEGRAHNYVQLYIYMYTYIYIYMKLKEQQSSRICTYACTGMHRGSCSHNYPAKPPGQSQKGGSRCKAFSGVHVSFGEGFRFSA